MKRVIAPLGLCLALAACGQSGDSAITPPEPAEPSSAVIPPGTRSSPAPTTTVVSGAGDTYGLPYGIELDFPHTLRVEIGIAHVLTPVTNAHLVCRPHLAKKKRRTH